MPILTSIALGSAVALAVGRLEQARGRQKARRQLRLRVSRRVATNAAAPKSTVSAAETEAAHQQWVSVGATALFGLGVLIYPPMTLAGLPLLAYNYAFMIRKMRQAYQNKQKLTVVVFDALTVSFAVLMGFFFTASLLFTALFTANRLIARTEREAHADFSRIFGELSDTVWLLKDGSEIETPLKNLQANDVIVLHAGDMIPVDGRVQGGEGLVDQHLLTGESQPVEKKAGDLVLTSTLLISGTMQVLVERQGAETITGQIAASLEHAATFKQNVQSRADRIVEKGALRTMLASGFALPFVGVNHAVALSYSGFGYQMRMAAPLMVLNYLRIASRSGILIKDGRALETLTRIDTVVFDKTGTLTEEVPQVERIMACDGHSRHELLQWAASAEQRQKHPIAQAILAQANERGLELLPLVSSDYLIGHGLRTELRCRAGEPSLRRVVLVGSQRFIASRAIPVPDGIAAMQAQADDMGHSVVYVADEGGWLMGAIELRPTPRPSARDTVTELHRLGISTCIISGDQEKPTRSLAAELGIEHYFAETLPTEKASLVNQLQEQGRTVCFIGDGINDSVALQKADVAVSLHGAATIAQDTAEVVLMNPDMMHLPVLVGIARELAERLDKSEILNNASGVACVSGVLLFGMGLSGAILLYSGGLLVSLSNALIPLVKHPERLKSSQLNNKRPG